MRIATRTIAVLAFLSAATLFTGHADARGYGRGGGYVNTPFGTVPMNMMQQSGGNPFVAEQMQEQMMMMRYQQMMMKQQQQYMQQMQKMQKAGNNPNSTMNNPNGNTQQRVSRGFQ